MGSILKPKMPALPPPPAPVEAPAVGEVSAEEASKDRCKRWQLLKEKEKEENLQSKLTGPLIAIQESRRRKT